VTNRQCIATVRVVTVYRRLSTQRLRYDTAARQKNTISTITEKNELCLVGADLVHVQIPPRDSTHSLPTATATAAPADAAADASETSLREILA